MAFVTSLAENTPIFDEDFFDRKKSELFFLKGLDWFNFKLKVAGFKIWIQITIISKFAECDLNSCKLRFLKLLIGHLACEKSWHKICKLRRCLYDSIHGRQQRLGIEFIAPRNAIPIVGISNDQFETLTISTLDTNFQTCTRSKIKSWFDRLSPNSCKSTSCCNDGSFPSSAFQKGLRSTSHYHIIQRTPYQTLGILRRPQDFTCFDFGWTRIWTEHIQWIWECSKECSLRCQVEMTRDQHIWQIIGILRCL